MAREELEEWTVDMDVTFRARGLDGALDVAHVIADALESLGQGFQVTLGDNYRREVDSADPGS